MTVTRARRSRHVRALGAPLYDVLDELDIRMRMGEVERAHRRLIAEHDAYVAGLVQWAIRRALELDDRPEPEWPRWPDADPSPAQRAQVRAGADLEAALFEMRQRAIGVY